MGKKKRNKQPVISCPEFLLGTCQRGLKCRFSHGGEEPRADPDCEQPNCNAPSQESRERKELAEAGKTKSTSAKKKRDASKTCVPTVDGLPLSSLEATTLAPEPPRKKVRPTVAPPTAGNASALPSLRHPFATDYGDHFETPRSAYEHLAPCLALLANRLGTDATKLRIYDPFYW